MAKRKNTNPTQNISLSPENRAIALADYQPHPRNYNRHPAVQIEPLAKPYPKRADVGEMKSR